MKSVKMLALIFLTLCGRTALFAQKQINEATLVYNISVESTDDRPERAKSLGGALLTLYVKGTQSRSDMSSALGTESNLYDARSGKGFILKEYSGQKLMITLNKDNWLQKNQYYQNLKFNIEGGEQMIAGFKSKKATAVLPNGKIFTVYFTSELVLSNNQYNNAFIQLPGVPVQYEMNSGNLIFKYVLSNVSLDPVPSAKFEIPKTGYRVMTYDENQQLKKGDKK
jgi:GLPGLI family protein